MKYAVIRDNKVASIIDSTPNQVENIIKPSWMTIVLIEGLDPMPQIDWSYVDGQFSNTLVLQQQREEKLNVIRQLRDEKLNECDVMINELTLGIRADSEAIKLYRQSLLDITDPYKDGEGNATGALDNVDPNDASIWPSKPGEE